MMSIFYLVILLLSIPTGLLISWLARDELIDGHNYLKMLFIISLGLAVIGINEVLTLTFAFISIVAYISVVKRYDKKWAVERKR